MKLTEVSLWNTSTVYEVRKLIWNSGQVSKAQFPVALVAAVART
jgi:hypothetical protein